MSTTCENIIHEMYLLPNGNVLTIGESDKFVTIWDITSLIPTIKNLPNEPICLIVLSDQKIIFSTHQHDIYLWNIEKSEPETVINFDTYISFLNLHPNGQLIIGFTKNDVQIWDLKTQNRSDVVFENCVSPYSCTVLNNGNIAFLCCKVSGVDYFNQNMILYE